MRTIIIKSVRLMTLAATVILCPSCEGFLAEKNVKALEIPDDAKSLWALLDNHNQLVLSGSDLPDILCGDWYVTAANWRSANAESRDLYVWDAQADAIGAWRSAYQGPIHYANVVLDALAAMDADRPGAEEYGAIRGTALFHRAYSFWQLAQLFCGPYHAPSAQSDPGIPLRLTAAIGATVGRGTVAGTYARIVADLGEALERLPERAAVPTRPDRTAAKAALARIYLSMGDYGMALRFADLALEERPGLLDFNEIADNVAPFRRFNVETVFYNNASGQYAQLSTASRAKVDSMLYSLYDRADLRKALFFEANTGANAGTYRFKGNYDGELSPNRPFTGLTTGELYLIRAECHARRGNVAGALAGLDRLLAHRWSNDIPRIPPAAANASEALGLVLLERRKELAFRGLRWSDLRRLNLEGAGISLTRVLDEETYTLPAGDPRWVLLIPNEVINRSVLEQNPR